MKYNGSLPRFMLKVWFLTFRKHVNTFVRWLDERKKGGKEEFKVIDFSLKGHNVFDSI